MNRNEAFVYSALLYAGAFIMPTWLGWCVAFYLVPLQKIDLKTTSFTSACLWSCVLHGVLLHGFFWFILQLGQGAVKYVALIGLLALWSAIGGLWLYCSALSAGKIQSRTVSCYFFTSLVFAYCMFALPYFLWPAGLYVGTFAVHPVLPSCSSAYARLLVLKSGIYGASFFILTSNILGQYAINKSQRGFFVFVALLSSIFFYSSERCQQQERFVYKGNVFICPNITFKEGVNLYDRAFEISRILERVGAEYPDAENIVFPESTFPFPLNMQQPMLELFYSALPEQAVLYLGAHKQRGGKLYNTFYKLLPCRIILSYDKCNLLPYTEFLFNNFCFLFYLNRLFLHKKICFSPGRQKRPLWYKKELCLQPYICSEFLFNYNKSVPAGVDLVICAMNDSWFSCTYIHELLMRVAQLKSLLYQRSVLYVGYHRKNLFHY